MKATIILTASIFFAAIALACSSHTPVANTTNGNSAVNGNAAATPGGAVHGNMMHDRMDPSMVESSANAASAPYDLQFIDTMSVHHQAAVDMASLVPKRAGHAEIQALAADIMLGQLKEISDMKSWRGEWFKDAAPAVNMELPGMHDSMKDADMKNLEGLKGTDFDLEFIRQMIPHHEGAVQMAKDAEKRATKPQLKTLAAAIVKAQEAEIANMKQWQKAWGKEPAK